MNDPALYSCSSSWRRACAAALAGLPALGPARLESLLADMPPEVAWETLGGHEPLPTDVLGARSAAKELRGTWRRAVRRTNPLDVIEAYEAQGVDVWCQLDEYPEALRNDLEAPAVLFSQGDVSALESPRVAIIGTRRCSSEGRDIARRFGAELSEAGVCVVSGLALGIDGAAHRGALEAYAGAPPIGVVGSGLDVIYPTRHKTLWEQVREAGLLLTESPLGAKPEPWRFPARNRMIAALAQIVVVVESHESGGSLLTVDEALKRDVDVMSVPGSIRSPACRGTNALLRDGFAPACSTEDILLALHGDTAALTDHGTSNPTVPPPPLDPSDRWVLEAVEWQPTSLDEVLARTGSPLGEVAAAISRLQQAGWIEGGQGWWRRTDYELPED